MDNQPIRVLVIEDDADEAGIIGSYLANPSNDAEGFAIVRAARISTACHLLGQREFDAILIDLVLPHSIGLEGFQKIRALKPEAPIIVLTGLQDEPLAIQALGLGAQDYLIKGSPDCCLLKRSIRYAIEKKRLTNIIEGLLAAPTPAVNGDVATISKAEDFKEGQWELVVKKRLILQITHELRNTLATVKTAAYCLKQEIEGSLTARQTRMVEMIARNVDRQTRIIGELLDMTSLNPDEDGSRLGGEPSVLIGPGFVNLHHAANGGEQPHAAHE